MFCCLSFVCEMHNKEIIYRRMVPLRQIFDFKKISCNHVWWGIHQQVSRAGFTARIEDCTHSSRQFGWAGKSGTAGAGGEELLVLEGRFCWRSGTAGAVDEELLVLQVMNCIFWSWGTAGARDEELLLLEVKIGISDKWWTTGAEVEI